MARQWRAFRGARCEIVEGNYDETVARSALDASDDCLVISDTSWEGYAHVPRWVIEGYSTIFWEIDEQMREEAGDCGIDAVFIQVGVGALAAAATHHFLSSDREHHPAMVGVEPTRADCILASVEAGHIVTIPGSQDSIMVGLNCGTPSQVAWPAVVTGYNAYVAIEDRRAEEGMRLLASEGIVAGETGAAGLGGLLLMLERPADGAKLNLGQDARVLLISTEGATDPENYERIVSGAAIKKRRC